MHRYALVVIDMQRGFLDASSPLFIPGAADTVPACARAIDCCHRAGVPVVFAVRHYRADGSDVERARYDVWARGGPCPRRARLPCPTRGRRNFTGRTRTMLS